MKVLKVILTILLTLIMIVVGFATEIIAIVNLTVMNPSFYKNSLMRIGLYENVHSLVVDTLEEFIEDQEGIPDNQKQAACDIIKKALPQEKFERQVGEFLGDTVDFFLYDNRNGTIPLQALIDDIDKEIKKSDLVVNNEAMDHILTVTLSDYFQTFNIGTSKSVKISDVFYEILAPTQKIKERLDSTMWVFRYWVKWANIGTFIGLAALLVILALLFIIWHKSVGVVFKLTGVLLLINSIFTILGGVSMFVGITLTKLLDIFPAFLEDYTSIVQSVMNPLGLVTLIIGIVVLVLGIILLVIGGAISRKTNEKAIVHVEVKNQVVTENLPIEEEIPLVKEPVVEVLDENEKIENKDNEEIDDTME
ncbi:MAG: hypothetical protein KAQ68_07680 [Clostridiales bacterium]|nr:hypothetical protein [Clostridiales bacterium]